MDATAYGSLREHCAWMDLTGRGKIRVTGDDRVRLLHAMSTNHIEQLQPGTGCYAFFLSPQGRILADVNVFCMPDYLLLDTEPETKQRVYEHLDKYIIADDVVLHDFTEATATITVEGPRAEAVLDRLGAMPAHASFSLVEWRHWQVARWSYTGGPGWAVYLPIEDKQQLVQELRSAEIPQADPETAEVVRLEYRHPRYGSDFSDAQIPQETRQMQAIHFAKGCYLGQEIVERVRSRGHVNRVLTALEVDTERPPSTGAKIQADGREAGEITSAAYSPAKNKVVAFAVVRAEALQPSTALSVEGAAATAAPVEG